MILRRRRKKEEEKIIIIIKGRWGEREKREKIIYVGNI
jgi:hypothetical protein